MVSVKQANVKLFDKIYPLLQKFDNPYLSKQDFRRLFTLAWKTEQAGCGYVLIDGEEVVGFLGMLFSEKRIGNQIFPYCNLCSWIVLEEYRKFSLLLFKPLFALKNHVITNLTPTPSVMPIFEKFGYKVLETERQLYLASLWGGWSMKWKISDEVELIESKLNPHDLEIFCNHQALACRHLIIYDQSKYCYLVFVPATARRIVKRSSIYYVSDMEIYLKVLNRVQWYLATRYRSCYTVIDRRFTKNFPILLGLKRPAIRLYLADQLPTEQIDNLYSELVVLPLS